MEYSKRSAQAVVFLAVSIIWPALSAGATPAKAPNIDKQFVAQYLRYAEAYTPQVQISVDDPKPSEFPGFYELQVHLRMNRNEAIRSYYVSEDGKQVVSGKIFELQKSPFADALSKLKPEGAPATGSTSVPPARSSPADAVAMIESDVDLSATELRAARERLRRS